MGGAPLSGGVARALRGRVRRPHGGRRAALDGSHRSLARGADDADDEPEFLEDRSRIYAGGHAGGRRVEFDAAGSLCFDGGFADGGSRRRQWVGSSAAAANADDGPAAASLQPQFARHNHPAAKSVCEGAGQVPAGRHHSGHAQSRFAHDAAQRYAIHGERRQSGSRRRAGRGARRGIQHDRGQRQAGWVRDPSTWR